MKKLMIAASMMAAFGVASVATPVLAAPTCAEQLKIVKTEWDAAAAGPKKEAALKHYTAAEKAHKAKEDKSCLTHLDQAMTALEATSD